MNQNKDNEDKAGSLINFFMRQMSGGYYPLKMDEQSELLKLVDAKTAQRIYDEEIAKTEEFSGPLPRWDSDTNAPVPGTPKP